MKFSIRDLFLVTVIVALVLGWGVDRSRLARRLEPYVEFEKAFDASPLGIGPMPNSSAPAPNQPKKEEIGTWAKMYKYPRVRVLTTEWVTP